MLHVGMVLHKDSWVWLQKTLKISNLQISQYTLVEKIRGCQWLKFAPLRKAWPDDDSTIFNQPPGNTTTDLFLFINLATMRMVFETKVLVKELLLHYSEEILERCNTINAKGSANAADLERIFNGSNKDLSVASSKWTKDWLRKIENELKRLNPLKIWFPMVSPKHHYGLLSGHFNSKWSFTFIEAEYTLDRVQPFNWNDSRIPAVDSGVNEERKRSKGANGSKGTTSIKKPKDASESEADEGDDDSDATSGSDDDDDDDDESSDIDDDESDSNDEDSAGNSCEDDN